MKKIFFIILLIVIGFIYSFTAGAYSRKCRNGEGPKGFSYKKNHWARYGHWCGPGFMGISSCYKNNLDKACMEHDLCERRNIRRGHQAHSCWCDLIFIKKAQKIGGFHGNLFAKIIKQRNNKKCLSYLK